MRIAPRVCFVSLLAVTTMGTLALSPAFSLGDDNEFADTSSYSAPDEIDSDRPAPDCNAHWVYNITDRSRRMSVFDGVALINHRDYRAEMGVHSQESGTSTYTVGASVSASASAAIFAEIKAEVNSSVSKSVTATIGFYGSTVVPPHSTAYGDYGVLKERTYGKSYLLTDYCNKMNVHYTAAAAPWRRAWRFSD